MADKFVGPGLLYVSGNLNDLDNRRQVIRLHGHAHCDVCGACFTAGMTESIHKCPKPVNPEVLEVFLLDSNRVLAKPTSAANMDRQLERTLGR